MKKALTVLLALLAGAVIYTVTASAADSRAPTVSFDTKTATLTLKAGNVKKADVQAYRKKDVKHVTAEKGAVLPEDCEKMFEKFRAEDIDLSGADTSEVKNMRCMFMDCAGLKSVDLSGINTSGVTDMSSMFRRCELLKTIDLSSFDTSGLISADYMFSECTKLKTIDLTGFGTESIEYWDHMFGSCTSLETIYVSDKWKGVKESYVTTWLLEEIFDGCISIKGGNGTTYDKDAKADKIYARIDKDGEPGYLTYKTVMQWSDDIKSPSRVSYKIVNHDKVLLKWGAAEGVDGYILYITDSEAQSFAKVAELTKTSCTLRKLTPDTQYTYAVTAFTRSGDKITESAPCAVTFTTPYKWYYQKGAVLYNGDGTVAENDTENVYRCHYDGSGLRKFNYFKYIPEEWRSEGATEKSYKVDDVQQYGGYIYFYLTNLDEFIDDVGYSHETYRIKSGGTKFEKVYTSGTPDRKLVLDDGNSYLGYDSGKENGELIYLTDAKVQKTVVDKNGNYRAITLFSEKGWYISNFAKDLEYLYFFTTPYRIDENEKFDEEDYEPSKYAKLWRISLDEPEDLAYDKYGYLKMPDTKTIPECIGRISFPYLSGNNAEKYSYTDDIHLVGCKDEYLYYCVSERKTDEDDINEVLYRISTEKKNAKPEKLTKLDIDNTRFDIQIYGNYIYITTERGGWRIKLGGEKFTLKQTFSINADEDEDSGQFTAVIENGYIYFRSGETYYRVKLNGKNLTSSRKPFAWR